MTVVAAFDVDGTLTTHDCVVPFMRSIRGTLPLAARLLARGHRLTAPVVHRDRDRIKAVAAEAAFGGVAVARLETEGAAFADLVVARRLRDDTVARLRWHRGCGHEVVLVSASFEVYLDPLGRAIGADAALGTRLVVDSSGRCTGELDGPNCRAGEKVARLHRWLDDHHGGRSGVELWAYGDSPGDRDLLADADHSVWANEPLTTVAPR